MKHFAFSICHYDIGLSNLTLEEFFMKINDVVDDKRQKFTQGIPNDIQVEVKFTGIDEGHMTFFMTREFTDGEKLQEENRILAQVKRQEEYDRQQFDSLKKQYGWT